MARVEDPVDLLPLTPRVFLILWALAEREQHGYALLREVEALSRGRVTIKPGSLYEAIDTLARRGLIEETEATESDGGPRRQPYRITAFGREVFAAEAARLDELVADLRDAKLTG
jgi:DNA-binding PadR family transcriptional regulator